jgi:hypothetical protein
MTSANNIFSGVTMTDVTEVNETVIDSMYVNNGGWYGDGSTNLTLNEGINSDQVS